jgi:hypothetical protein
MVATFSVINKSETLPISDSSGSRELRPLKVIGLEPRVKGSKLTMAEVPIPFAPTLGPLKVFAVKLTVPASLLIVPGIKKMGPPPDKNDEAIWSKSPE